MDYLFICYPRCTTCQKAKKWLDAKGISYRERNIKEDKPSNEELANWIGRDKYPVRSFFNTSGQIYRDLGLKNKIDKMTLEEIIDLLATDGMLVKRPILVSDDKLLVAFKEAEWEENLA